MHTGLHNMQSLFQQLGLATSSTAIEAFFYNNRLPQDIPLERAAFWSAGQAQFLQESIAEDSDWAEAVDQLDAQLRH
ncbi:MAG: DUF2789 domain-containing protein [Pseudomonadales bacterium]|nr:DUF2789 domain-containing protein [Pseudomonadales bacterium]